MMPKKLKPVLILAVLFLLIITACNNSTERSVNKTVITESDSLELKNIKEVLWPQAYRQQDTVLLDWLLDESFQFVNLEGKTSYKKDELERIKLRAMDHDSFAFEIKRLDIYDNGTAVVAGTGHIKNDSTYSIYQSSNVLIKRDSIWKAVLSHISGFKQISPAVQE